MKHLLPILTALLLLSSCRTINKSLGRTQVTENTVAAISTTSTETTAATSSTTATRTITEETTGVIDTPGSVATASSSGEDLHKGVTARTETNDQVIEIRQDPNTGVITATATVKPKQVPLSMKKTTQEVINTANASAVVKRADQTVKLEGSETINNTTIDTSKKPGASVIIWSLAILTLLILLVLALRWYLKRK